LAQDRCRDLILDGKDILQPPVVLLAPHMVAVAGVDELRGDAEPIARFVHAAFHYRAHVQLTPNLAHIGVVPLERER